ncbi:MAG: hypothetical protein ACI83N_001843 [Hydrogenophaga sp.]
MRRKKLKSTDQLLLARELGRTAFHAGKPCSPVGDENFMAFLWSCGRRSVGVVPAGEAPTLTLLVAWIAQWRVEAHHPASPIFADSGQVGGIHDQTHSPSAESLMRHPVLHVASQ